MSARGEKAMLNMDFEHARSLAEMARYSVAWALLSTGETGLPAYVAEDVEALAVAVAEGKSYEEANELAAKRWGGWNTSGPEAQRYARKLKVEIEYRRGREYFLNSTADGLARLWGDKKGREANAEELIEVFFDRPPEDPERQELIEYVPGDERELAEVLRRRWEE